MGDEKHLLLNDALEEQHDVFEGEREREAGERCEGERCEGETHLKSSTTCSRAKRMRARPSTPTQGSRWVRSCWEV